MSTTAWAAGKRVRKSVKGFRLLVEIAGDFDITVGLHVWNACRADLGVYRSVIFDMSKIGQLDASGLAWLILFHRYASRQKVRLTLVLGQWDIADRCEQAGLNVAMLVPEAMSGYVGQACKHGARSSAAFPGT